MTETMRYSVISVNSTLVLPFGPGLRSPELDCGAFVADQTINTSLGVSALCEMGHAGRFGLASWPGLLN